MSAGITYEMTSRELLESLKNKTFDFGGINMWYDWFCKDKSLINRQYGIMPKVKKFLKVASEAGLVDLDKTYVFFKNNCGFSDTGSSRLFDDFRVCDIETGDVLFTVVPSNVYHEAELWTLDETKNTGEFSDKIFNENHSTHFDDVLAWVKEHAKK